MTNEKIQASWQYYKSKDVMVSWSANELSIYPKGILLIILLHLIETLKDAAAYCICIGLKQNGH